jgi:Cu/Ag efflux protein CusF
MKKHIAAFATILLTASVALALTQMTEQKPATTTYTGEVVSVSTMSNQIVIKDQMGQEQTLTIAANAAITREGKTIKLADIKAYDQVTINCEQSADKQTCQTVGVTAGQEPRE